MRLVISRDDVKEIAKRRNDIRKNIERTVDHLRTILKGEPLEVLFQLKFTRSAHDPLTGEAMNLIEHINQSWTCLASLSAVEFLFKSHPDVSKFRLNLGVTRGFDIEDLFEPEPGDGCLIGSEVFGTKVAAEVYSATSINGNRKLAKERRKLRTTSGARQKYVFFFVPEVDPGRHQDLEANAVNLEVWSLSDPSASLRQVAGQ
jgi:hypothetical protein